MQASASGLRLATLACLAATVLVAQAPVALAQVTDTIPSRTYYNGIEDLYQGDLSDALRTFRRSLTGSVKTIGETGTVRWIDSICYHAMMGEVFYHWGQPQQALEQFDLACTLYLQYPKWMLRVQFNQQLAADSNLSRVAIPWGVSQRRYVPGRFNTTMPISQGSIDASQQVQQGGVVTPAQLWPVDVVEINRCTALAIRRRNEILGPLGAHDSLSRTLASTLSRGTSPPNHWSNAWSSVLQGVALAGIGDREQAQQRLEQGLLAAGQFDHPLTCVSLLEQGKLALEAGNASAAAGFFAEASYSAYLFRDAGMVDDAFRWNESARMAANVAEPDPSLVNALAWARRERYDLISARLSLAMAEATLQSGNLKAATPMLAAGVALLRDARNGILGNYAQYLDARFQFTQDRGSAEAALQTALAGQQKISHRLFQLARANAMFDAQTLAMRSAAPVYEALLADPSPSDVAMRPLESMAVMMTPQPEAYHRWLLAAIDRKNMGAVLEITDFAKRRRYHNELPWGGRMAAVRDLVCAPPQRLTPEQRQQQTEIMSRSQALSRAMTEAGQLQTELGALWTPSMDDAAKKKAARLWNEYNAAIGDCDAEVARAAVGRLPADISFPPTLTPIDFQSRLQMGQALLVFHDSPDGMLAILLTNKAVTSWNCGPSNRLGGQVSQFLRDLGNVDGNHEVPIEELASDKWQESAKKLYAAIFGGASIDPAALKQLIVIPDGVLWYVPFETLTAEVDGKPATLGSHCTIRYAPTAALAFSFDGAWRRIQRTGLVTGQMIPGDEPEQEQEAIAALVETLPGPMPLVQPTPVPTPILATLLDAAVVLDDVDALGSDPLAWSPLPVDRNAQQGSLAQWMMIPGNGPQRILLPGMHTAAERGGKAARSRRGGDSVAPGDELFFASCGLMASGADTLLLSRWRVGGQSTLDLIREFASELPHTAAAEAWQRSVQLIQETPVDPTTEMRVKAGKNPIDLTAKHPFFWAGYMVVDTGWRPVEQEDALGDPAAVGGQPVAGQPPAAGQQPGAAMPGEAKPAEMKPGVPAPPSPNAPQAVPEKKLEAEPKTLPPPSEPAKPPAPKPSDP